VGAQLKEPSAKTSVRLRRLGIVSSLVACFFAFAVTGAVSGSEQASVLHVCVQRGGSPENRGDLNVRLGSCAGGKRFALLFGQRLTAGRRGLRGPAGPRGPVGPSGPKGEVGSAGATGTAGVDGPAGPQGETGAKGDTGDTGPEGQQGETGPQGADGPPGEDGAPGPAGPAGADGAPGAPGPTGETGPQGPAGQAGATGAQGPPGATGPQGLPGATGPQGLPGATGPQGPTGPAASQVTSNSGVSTSPQLDTTVTVTASCPAGKALLGGGAQATNSDATHPARVAIVRSSPGSASSWTATGVISAGLGAPNAMTVTAYAVCTA
jgi:hypothetical protein